MYHLCTTILHRSGVILRQLTWFMILVYIYVQGEINKHFIYGTHVMNIEHIHTIDLPMFAPVHGPGLYHVGYVKYSVVVSCMYYHMTV